MINGWKLSGEKNPNASSGRLDVLFIMRCPSRLRIAATHSECSWTKLRHIQSRDSRRSLAAFEGRESRSLSLSLSARDIQTPGGKRHSGKMQRWIEYALTNYRPLNGALLCSCVLRFASRACTRSAIDAISGNFHVREVFQSQETF